VQLLYKRSAARELEPQKPASPPYVQWLQFLSHRCRSASPILAVWCSSSGSGGEVAGGAEASVAPNRT